MQEQGTGKVGFILTLGLQVAATLVCVPMTSILLLLLSAQRKHERTLWMSLFKMALILSDQGSTFMNSFNLNYFFRGTITKHSHTRAWGFNM